MTEIDKLLKENFDYNMANIHTSFPGVVEKYDAKTRRACVQPSLKRMLPNGSFMAFPVIANVPVLFYGTKKTIIHFQIEKGDEVLLICCERCTDDWLESGGKDIEDKDPRRFSIQDCFAIPGLQAKDFAEYPQEGFAIVDNKTQIVIKGNKVAIRNGSKSLFTILDTILQTIIGMKTVGPPAQHTVSPPDIQSFTQLQTDLGQLMEA